jgi:hypothetical protein
MSLKSVTRDPVEMSRFLASLGYSKQSIVDTLMSRTDLSPAKAQELAGAAIVAANR